MRPLASSYIVLVLLEHFGIWVWLSPEAIHGGKSQSWGLLFSLPVSNIKIIDNLVQTLKTRRQVLLAKKERAAPISKGGMVDLWAQVLHQHVSQTNFQNLIPF